MPRCGFTVRPTVHTAPGRRSIQITIRSAAPASSRPSTTRSANRQAGFATFTALEYTKVDWRRGPHPGHPAQSLLVSLPAPADRGARRRIPRARASQRPFAERDSRRRVREEPLHTAAGSARARAARGRARTRRGHRRRAPPERRIGTPAVEHVRVAIVGGGVAGCSLAYHLTQRGWDGIVVLEQAELTSGSTWHSAGLCTQFNPSYNLMGLLRYSVELYQRLDAEG